MDLAEMTIDELRDLAETLTEKNKEVEEKLEEERKRNSEERKKMFRDFFEGVEKKETEENDGKELFSENLKILANRLKNR